MANLVIPVDTHTRGTSSFLPRNTYSIISIHIHQLFLATGTCTRTTRIRPNFNPICSVAAAGL